MGIKNYSSCIFLLDQRLVLQPMYRNCCHVPLNFAVWIIFRLLINKRRQTSWWSRERQQAFWCNCICVSWQRLARSRSLSEVRQCQSFTVLEIESTLALNFFQKELMLWKWYSEYYNNNNNNIVCSCQTTFFKIHFWESAVITHKKIYKQ